MNLRALSLCIFFLHLNSLAFASVGFLKVEDPSIPASVKNAAKSVIKIYSQGGNFDQTLDMTDSNKVSQEKARFKAQNNWWENLQIQYCERLKVKDCHLFSQLGEGSAFLSGNQSTLYSNLHNFNEILSVKVKTANAVTRTDIFKILNLTDLFLGAGDADQKSVFDPTTDLARLSFFNPDPALFDGTRSSMLNVLGRLSDIVEIKTSSPLSYKPLMQSSQKAKVGDTVYLIGFPAETTDRAAMGVQDSDGETQYITVGKVMDAKTWVQKTKNNLLPIVQTLFDKHMILVDFDCQHGNSGGPIVNSNGEVVGIMMGMWMDMTVNPNTRICGGLNTLDKKELEALWQVLAN